MNRVSTVVLAILGIAIASGIGYWAGARHTLEPPKANASAPGVSRGGGRAVPEGQAVMV